MGYFEQIDARITSQLKGYDSNGRNEIEQRDIIIRKLELFCIQNNLDIEVNR